MDNLDEMRKMAGIEVISEEMGSRSMQMARTILQMAEANAYDEGAEVGNVTSDNVAQAAQAILADIEKHIMAKLQSDMDQNQSAEIEHEMGADRNMEMGETNFKAG